MTDPFIQAHADAVNAVMTFLPSLNPAPVPPQPAPRPLPPKMAEAVRAASVIHKVETASRRVARGLSPEPPPPPSPQETFPPAIDQVHIRALAAAIAAHPETDRPALLHEAHQNLVKWVASHSGQVVIDGHVEIADSPQSAEKLAARIVNEAVDQHDERRAAALSVSMEPDGKKGTGVQGAGAGKEKQLPGGVSGRVSGGDQPQRSPQVGASDPDTGRVVTQSSPDLSEAQDTATAAAPELKDTLGQAVEDIPDAEVDGVREEKDPERAQQKADVDDKPVHTQTDLLAGRIAVDSPEAKDAVVDQLKDSAPVIDEDDKFQDGDPDYGFRSHTLQVALGKGKTSAEVQVVPKEIADADDDTHDTYKQGRQAEAEGDDETAEQAMDENKAAHDEAMDKFNERNQDRSSKIVASLTGAGFKVQGKPLKIGGHLFVSVEDSDGR